MEIQAILAFMAYRQIRENEVSGLFRTIEIGDTGDRYTSQDSGGLRRGASSLGDDTVVFQTHVQDESSVVGKSDIGAASLILRIAFVDVQLDYRWWIDRTTVGGCCQILINCLSQWSHGMGAYTSIQHHTLEHGQAVV